MVGYHVLAVLYTYVNRKIDFIIKITSAFIKDLYIIYFHLNGRGQLR